MTEEEKAELKAELEAFQKEFESYKKNPTKWQIKETTLKAHEVMNSVDQSFTEEGDHMHPMERRILLVCLAHIPGMAVDMITKIAKFQQMMLKEDLEAQMIQSMADDREVN